MARKPIPEATQKNVLLKSRRRCCLCFWLEGRDEVMKGQIAHLDQNHENAAEDNLAFLCLDHHDEYDGKTSQSKGLREGEVRDWRDELYKEMEHRFRTVRRRGLELSILHFVYCGPRDEFRAVFKLKNTGEVEVRSPVVSIRLPHNVAVKLPPRPYLKSLGGVALSLPDLDPYAIYESQQDVFEPNGRVAVKELRGINPVLMRDHAETFEGLVFHLKDYPPGSTIELEYRIDAEDMVPVLRKVVATVPASAEEFVLPEDWDDT